MDTDSLIRRRLPSAQSRWALAAVGAAVIVVLAALSIDTSGLNFYVDKRVHITAPKELEEVDLPYSVEWRADQLGTRAAHFALFIDRDPMPPGKNLEWLARNDKVCGPDPSCPNESWLDAHNVHVTDRRSFLISALVDRRGKGEKHDRHIVTTVLLDRDFRRVGESAWWREFIVAR